MSRAHYNYAFTQIGGHKAIAIVDQDNGGMSVTNDIENVVYEISAKERLNPEQYLIVYEDSEGIWDGWDAKKRGFVSLRSQSLNDSLAAYMAVKGYSLN